MLKMGNAFEGKGIVPLTRAKAFQKGPTNNQENPRLAPSRRAQGSQLLLLKLKQMKRREKKDQAKGGIELSRKVWGLKTGSEQEYLLCLSGPLTQRCVTLELLPHNLAASLQLAVHWEVATGLKVECPG